MCEHFVVIIGSGAREHAIAWKLSQSPQVAQIFLIPGSYGIGSVKKTRNENIDPNDFEAVARFCIDNDITVVIVGPEAPLAKGIANVLRRSEVQVFGPGREGAQIESDKSWAKSFFDRHDIPTAQWNSFDNAQDAKAFINSAPFPALVVKASGLAAGKGVIVASSKKEACEAVDVIMGDKKFGSAGETIVIEELLTGEEVSVLAVTDGKSVQLFPPAQDHKRLYDGDLGPNTGGMGAYCPCTLITLEQLEYVKKNIFDRTIEGLRKENIPYVGVLYAGLMITPNGIKILEYNCRFGDPETEVILPLLETDLFEIVTKCCKGELATLPIKWKQNVCAVGVVVASKGYPESSNKGQPIIVKPDNSLRNIMVFYYDKTWENGELVTNGGRVLIAVALESSLPKAASDARRTCKLIDFEGRQFRNDIALRGVCRSILSSGTLSYKQCGVDITAGNDLVSQIKPITKSTDRAGALGSLGGFAGLFDLKAAGFQDPILVSGTDGVGTKLKIAQELDVHDTIGIDLVAMCVNDVLAHGAEPLFFLDYFACGRLDVNIAKDVISGVAQGCIRAGCALIGGETAEMPDIYSKNDYDLAGFAVGAVERDEVFPRLSDIVDGDVVIGLPSSGIHSNGFSLVRNVMKLANVRYTDLAMFSDSGKSYGQEFLTPTKIYVKPLLPLIQNGSIKAFAHITGGGLLENIPRILRDPFMAKLDATKWTIPNVFAWIAAHGVNEHELLRTLNCGIGGVVIVSKRDASRVVKELEPQGATIIGEIKPKLKSGESVIVEYFSEVMELLMRQYVLKTIDHLSEPKKRVAVLISGDGTNLQALIDATYDTTQDMGADIVLVISNKDDVKGLKRATRAGIPTKVISHKDYGTREEYDRVLHEQLMLAGVEIVCLAGFMRILSAEFTNKWRGKLINIHPSLLPSFKGADAQVQAFEAGVRVTGCTAHFVEADIDSGPIICQEAVPILPGDTVTSVTRRIRAAEHRIFPEALKLVATEKARLNESNKVVWYV